MRFRTLLTTVYLFITLASLGFAQEVRVGTEDRPLEGPVAYETPGWDEPYYLDGSDVVLIQVPWTILRNLPSAGFDHPALKTCYGGNMRNYVACTLAGPDVLSTKTRIRAKFSGVKSGDASRETQTWEGDIWVAPASSQKIDQFQRQKINTVVLHEFEDVPEYGWNRADQLDLSSGAEVEGTLTFLSGSATTQSVPVTITIQPKSGVVD